MNKVTDIEIISFANRGKELLKRSSKVLKETQSEKVRDLSNRIPEDILSNEEKITLVIAGQYGAGKSTILAALTGRSDIPIGGGITTQNIHTYEWDIVKVIDTPGIHTELRPDHDEISYRAISNSDLILFVVTNELFDSHMAKHFRKLAIEKDKAHEMMLIVNKMQRCDKGNTTEMQNIISQDLRKVLLPFSPEELRISFTDAETFVESQKEINPEIASTLRRKSGFEPFTAKLNTFIREKGHTGRFTTSLYKLEQVLQEALASESRGDKDVDALIELLLQRRRALLETRDRIPSIVDKEIQNIATQVRLDGRKVADLIHGKAKQKEVDLELQNAQARVQVHAEECGQNIEKLIVKQISGFDERVDNIFNSELAKELLPRLTQRIPDPNISPEILSKIKDSADISQKLGKFLIENSVKSSGSGTLGGILKLGQYSGTNAHMAVKSVGNFFGKSFKPWEAVKWSKGIANAGRVLAVVGTVLTFVMQIKEDADAAQLEIDLRESRASIRSGFNEAARAIEMHFDKATGSFIARTFDPEIESIDKQLSELREMQQIRGNLYQSLSDLLEETQKLIKKIHMTTSE